MPPKVSAAAASDGTQSVSSAGSSMASAESDEPDDLRSLESGFVRPKPIITVAGANDVASALSPKSPGVTVSSPIQIAMPSTAMSIDEQRHRLMQDMLTMQSRLLGEQRVLQEIMQDSAEKSDSYSIMAAAVSEQEESLRSEKQVLGELKKAEADTMTFELQVLTQDVQGLQHQMERFRQLEAENSQMGERMEQLRQRRGELCLTHAAKQSQLNGDMLKFRIRLEQLFRKSVLEHSKQCQRAAFASLSDSDKQQLLQNVLLAEELSLQRVGMDNLRYRYDQLGQDCIRTRTEVSAFQHNSQAYARTIAQLRRIQSKIDAQALTITAQYADKLKEHEQIRRGVNLSASIAQLRSEVKDYEQSCRRAQASCSKWKARLAEAQQSRQLLKQHIHEAHEVETAHDASTRSSGTPQSSAHSSSRLGRGTCGRPATPLDPRLLDYLLHYQPCAAPAPTPPPNDMDSTCSGLSSYPSSASLAPHTLVAEFGFAATQHRMAAASPNPLQLYKALKTKLHHWTREDHRNPTDPTPSPALARTCLDLASPRPSTTGSPLPAASLHPLSPLPPTAHAPRPSRRDIYEARVELMSRQAPPLQHPLQPYHRPRPPRPSSRPRVVLMPSPDSSRPTTSPSPQTTAFSTGRYLLGRTAPHPMISDASIKNQGPTDGPSTPPHRGETTASWTTPRRLIMTERPTTCPGLSTTALPPPTRRLHMQPFVTFKDASPTITGPPTSPSLCIGSPVGFNSPLCIGSPSGVRSPSGFTGPSGFKSPTGVKSSLYPPAAAPRSPKGVLTLRSPPASPKPTTTTRRLPSHTHHTASHTRRSTHRSTTTSTKGIHSTTAKPSATLQRPPPCVPKKKPKRRPLTPLEAQGMQWGGHRGDSKAALPSRLRGTLHRALDANSEALQHISLQHRLERQRQRRRAMRAAAAAHDQGAGNT